MVEGTFGTDDPSEPDDPDDPDGTELHPLEALEQGRVDPRLLRPDPGETRQQFEERLLATVLGLDVAGTADDDRDGTDGTAGT